MMEKMLQKIARQLDGMDEASLMALWSKYATLTSRFEPTKRWEEACLVFSLIQAKHFKNQLFNYCWKQERNPAQDLQDPGFIESFATNFTLQETPPKAQAGCRVLSFTQPSESFSQDEETPES